jgi:integrase
MKSAREHRVPLALRAVVRGMPRGTYVFPGRRLGSPLHEQSLMALLRRMQVDGTVHGFRSSFKDWAAETTTFANELSEADLAHVIGDKVERAYRRGDALERRRELMEAWAQFCESAENNRE